MELLGVGIGDVVHVQETTDLGVIVTRLQVVKTRFYVCRLFLWTKWKYKQ